MISSYLLSRLNFRNLLIASGVFCVLAAYSFWSSVRPFPLSFSTGTDAAAVDPQDQANFSAPWVSCFGPRGKRIVENPDDQMQTRDLGPYPQPFAGSYDALGLKGEWATAEERYGPYGYDNDQGKPGSNKRQPVDWEKVDWGQLQAQCFTENKHRFPSQGRKAFDAGERRLRLREPDDWASEGWLRDEVGADLPPAVQQTRKRTGRTAIVVRGFGKFAWTEEDKVSIRALISEAGLQMGGEFTVILFVNIRDKMKKIFDSEANYEKAFREAEIPPEFHNISVLWDENLLQSWYRQIEEHSIFYQINQSLQILALFYPEFDHFWQLELDIRYMGHVGKLLRSVDQFSAQEPRKQSVERASYLHFPSEHGSYYPDFLGKVNASLNGSATVWGPVSIPEVPQPIGPQPPSQSPEEDDFVWGVGDPADLVVTAPCVWVFRMRHWIFRHWFSGLSQKDQTPRMTCPPAIQRASRQLLLAVHTAQMLRGIAVPSEATLPSFALWHGLKFSLPPMPLFRRNSSIDMRTSNVWFNGGQPGEYIRQVLPWPSGEHVPEDDDAVGELRQDVEDYLHTPEGAPWRANGSTPITIPLRERRWRDWYRGFAAGESMFNQLPRLEWANGISWWWSSSFPRRLLDVWTGGAFDEGVPLAEVIEEADAIKAAQEAGNDEEAKRLMGIKKSNEEHESKQVLKLYEGRWYAPPGWLHPAKTRPKPA